MSGPLHLVLAEIGAGTPTLAEISRRTGLSDDVVRAAVDHLVRAGRVTSSELSLGCPTGGCGTCPSSPGCALPKALGARRPGLVSLTLTRATL
ncbi:MAG TPA: FeoC-like transcriptional regulator [Propionibacteriaceae bacterium]|nr:FeoC-like transcriptional regulator [Propionibacteriaceae bacterium]